MKRVITCLSLLLLLLYGAYAQDISQYEYWTDDDYAGRCVVSSSGGDISLEVSTAQLSAGVHFFNFRACRSDGVWGNFYRYLYYIPTLQGPDDGSVNVEYWIDDNYAGKQTSTSGDSNPMLTIDISSLASGVHYFNCRAYNERGEYGSPVREMFYIPQANPNTNATLSKAEYWLDDDYASKVNVETSETEQAYTIDISHLGPGVHYFNYRAFDNEDNPGSWIRELFYLAHAEQASSNEKIDYEYWIDDNTANKVTGSGTGSEYMFTIDVSGLSQGKHTFNFRAKNILDQWGDVFTEEFEITNGSQTSSYKLTYMVDGVEYKSSSVEYGKTITPEPYPTKEGYTFSGWSEIPSTMPANDVTVTGTFTVNKYKVTYIIDGEVFKTESVEYGASITPPDAPGREGYTFSWSGVPETMPAQDITITGSYTTDIDGIMTDEQEKRIFNMNGQRIDKLQKGINIIQQNNGKKAVKIMKK